MEWLSDLQQARSPAAKLQAASQFQPGMLKPVIGMERGLTDPIAELNMGQTAEVVAHLFGITRQQADEYALQSHQRLAHAQAEGWLENEVVPAISRDGDLYRADDGVRPGNSLGALAKLDPVFEPPHGQVTAGNSSQITDGASWIILASEQAVKDHGLKPIAKIVDSQWSALDPKIMGLGPVLAVTDLLKRSGHAKDEIDLWEINEAFAAQVLGCLAAWEDADFCRTVLDLQQPFGPLDRERLNVDGGAISLGHPVGTSGNRIVLHLVNALRRKQLRRGIATECIGGGQAGAMLIEMLEEAHP